jgi:hypothetical protein
MTLMASAPLVARLPPAFACKGIRELLAQILRVASVFRVPGAPIAYGLYGLNPDLDNRNTFG